MDSLKIKKLLILACFFTTLYIISNILANKIIVIWWFTVTASVLCYPLTFLIGNIITGNFGQDKTNLVIKTAFIVQILIVLLTTLVIFIPTNIYGKETSDAYKILFSQNFRIVIASLTSFFVSQKINIFFYNQFKKNYHKPLLSLIGANTLSLLVDIIIFISISFIGIIPLFELVIMFISQYLFQMFFLMIITIIVYFLSKKKKNLIK